MQSETRISRGVCLREWQGLNGNRRSTCPQVDPLRLPSEQGLYRGLGYNKPPRLTHSASLSEPTWDKSAYEEIPPIQLLCCWPVDACDSAG
jgi:hypothetical protein